MLGNKIGHHFRIVIMMILALTGQPISPGAGDTVKMGTEQSYSSKL